MSKITYEQAKELKDAGFPQSGKSCHWWHETGTSTSDEYAEGRCYIPELSELIEACVPRCDLTLTESGTDWEAGLYNFYDGEWVYYEVGKTPEEAVAKLYIALNKK